MRSRLLSLGAALVTALAGVVLAAPAAHAATGLHIEGRDIVEANGQKFVMRGVNHMHTWYANQTGSFADIKALGANTVRVVLSGGRWTANDAADVTNVINLCKQNEMICVLENHDTTGYGEDTAAYSLDQAADYWIGLKSVLAGQEDYVVINIGNEPIGNTDAGQWTAATVAAIQKMRGAGFEHLLMVDAPNWGQDWQYTMRDNAQTVLDADTRHNTVLSIHMYAVFNTAASITSYLDTFERNGWPLVIGEFGWRFDAGQVDHETLLAEADARDLGYLGWSWAGNTDPILDMAVGFDADNLSEWGSRIFNGPHGIKATAREASIFGGSSEPEPPVPGCTATYAVTGQWQGGFQGEVRVTAGTAALNGWTVTWTYGNGQKVTQAWGTELTSSGATVTGRNAAWNGRVAAGASASFGFIGSWTGANAVPSVSCSAA